jgi:hypothetical protein
MTHTIISDTESEITHRLVDSPFVAGEPSVHHVIYRTVVTEDKEPPLYHRWELESTTSEKVREEDRNGIVFAGSVYTHTLIWWLD